MWAECDCYTILDFKVFYKKTLAIFFKIWYNIMKTEEKNVLLNDRFVYQWADICLGKQKQKAASSAPFGGYGSRVRWLAFSQAVISHSYQVADICLRNKNQKLLSPDLSGGSKLGWSVSGSFLPLTTINVRSLPRKTKIKLCI